MSFFPANCLKKTCKKILLKLKMTFFTAFDASEKYHQTVFWQNFANDLSLKFD